MKIKYTKELMESAVKTSFSYADVCRKIGLKPIGSNYKTVKSKIKLYNLDTSHFTGQRWNKGLGETEKTAIYPLDDILRQGIIYKSSSLKNRLINSEIKKNECEVCHISGDEICLELHHINGDHYDNRIENLQILCPNCHSKTSNFRNKNGKNTTEAIRLEIKKNHLTICENCGKEFYSDRIDKKRRFCCRECYNEFLNKGNILGGNSNNSTLITKEGLKEQINNCSNITDLGKLLGVSRTTARKYLEKYDLYEEFKSKYDFHSKPVLQYDINNNLIKEWPSITDAEQTLGIYKISECCSFKRRSAGGFIWRYAN